MPPKKTNQNKVVKQKKKRKQISPLFEEQITQEACSSEHSKTGLTGVSPKDNTDSDSKRHRNLQLDYFVFDTPTVSSINNMNTGNMNFSQPFSGQYVQSPPGQFQFTQQSSPPQWAVDILNDVRAIKQKVEKIDCIEKAVNSINVKLNDLDLKVKDIDNRVNEMESTVSFIGNKYDKQLKEINNSQDEIKNLEKARKSLEKTVNSIQKNQADLRAKSLENEFRSMRDNLIFYGIPEVNEQSLKQKPTSASGSSETSEEVFMEAEMTESQSCEYLVKNFIKTNLEIDPSKMLFDRAHRLGNPKKAKLPRPIIVKFNYYKERELIREASFKKRDALKTIKCGVSAQIPKEWRDARQKLSTIYQAEKAKGNNVKFIGENLYINGAVYMPSENDA